MAELNSVLLAFVTLHLLGQAGVFILLITIILTKHAMRHRVFINICLSWLVYSGGYLLIFYAGQIDKMPLGIQTERSLSTLCSIQASMIYASGGLVGFTTFSLSFHLFQVVRRTIHHGNNVKYPHRGFIGLIIGPYALYIAIFILHISHGLSHPKLVHRSNLYCTIDSTVAHIGPGIAAVCSILTLIMQVTTVISLNRYRHAAKSSEPNELQVVNGSKYFLMFELVSRITVFTFCTAIGLMVCLLLLIRSNPPISNITLACLPLLFAVVFGSSKDIRKKFYCRRSRQVVNDGDDNDGG